MSFWPVQVNVTSLIFDANVTSVTSKLLIAFLRKVVAKWIREVPPYSPPFARAWTGIFASWGAPSTWTRQMQCHRRLRGLWGARPEDLPFWQDPVRWWKTPEWQGTQSRHCLCNRCCCVPATSVFLAIEGPHSLEVSGWQKKGGIGTENLKGKRDWYNVNPHSRDEVDFLSMRGAVSPNENMVTWHFLASMSEKTSLPCVTLSFTINKAIRRAMKIFSSKNISMDESWVHLLAGLSFVFFFRCFVSYVWRLSFVCGVMHVYIVFTCVVEEILYGMTNVGQELSTNPWIDWNVL